MTYYYESELYHHGIKGQKWGVRRYQNEDGTLTAAGKERYSYQDASIGGTKKYLNSDGTLTKKGSYRMYRELFDIEDDKKASKYVANPDRWINDDIDSLQKTMDSATKGLKSARELSATLKREPKRVNLDDMTDQELREKINRELLEKQYSSLFVRDEVNETREKVERFLSTAGAVTAVTSSALAIALAIRKLRGKD